MGAESPPSDRTSTGTVLRMRRGVHVSLHRKSARDSRGMRSDSDSFRRNSSRSCARERKSGRMTPQQRDHVRNEVLPKWQQMAPDRRQAIQQRLRVLQNMPESARNQRLNAPNFPRGM